MHMARSIWLGLQHACMPHMRAACRHQRYRSHSPLHLNAALRGAGAGAPAARGGGGAGAGGASVGTDTPWSSAPDAMNCSLSMG